jgi:hypothetical protein
MKNFLRLARPSVLVVAGVALMIGCSSDEPSGAPSQEGSPISQPDVTLDSVVDNSTPAEASTTTEVIETTTSIRGNATSTSTPRSMTTVASNGNTPTSTPRSMTTVASNGNTTTSSPYGNSPTSSPYGNTTTSITSPPGPPSGTWLRNDSHCSWQGASSCGVYSSGSTYWDVVGPAGGLGSTFVPIAGTPGAIAYNLYSGNSITNCDWNGSGGCGYYFTGTPGTFNIGALG